MRFEFTNNLAGFLLLCGFNYNALASAGIDGVFARDFHNSLAISEYLAGRSDMFLRLLHLAINITIIGANASYIYIRSQNANPGHTR